MSKKLSASKLLDSIFDFEEDGVQSDDEEDCLEIDDTSNRDLENEEIFFRSIKRVYQNYHYHF